MSRKSQADIMVELALNLDILLYTDQYDNPYIRFPLGPNQVYVTHSLKSGIVKDWLSDLLWSSNNKAPNTQASTSALAILRAKAREGPQIQLYNRIGLHHEGSILIDMANPGWNYIRVTPEKWSIESTGPPIFRRYKHQKEIKPPIKGGNPFDLLQFTNIEDEKQKLLYIVSAISYFIPEIQHPVLVFHGPHGSGKSQAMKATRALVDPSIIELLTLPNSDRELVQQLFHHYCPFYDNISTISSSISDIICRAVTGAGNSKRQLYTDDEDIIYEYRRCIALNGINIAAQRGDLLDRSVILGCVMMDNQNRRSEKELAEMIETYMPSILGGVLDTLVKALEIYPSVKLDNLFRMADFTRWGCAITEALGIDQQLFLDAYAENIKSQSDETIKASLLATVLIEWIDQYPDGIWRGAPSKLYDELIEYATSNNISTRQKAWPKTAHWMMRRLNEVSPSLHSAGYLIESDRSNKTRVVTIRKTSKTSVSSVTAVTDDDDSDSKNSKLGVFS